MYRSRLVARLIPAIGLVGVPLILASATGTIFGAWDHSTMGPGALPIAVWEFSLGVYLTIKGFRPVAAAPCGRRPLDGGVEGPAGTAGCVGVAACRRIDVPTPTGGCVRSMAGVGRLGR